MRILVTGSGDGIGRLTAANLMEAGHDVIIHGRSRERLEAASELLDGGAEWVVGDLADRLQMLDVARQANEIGRLDAVIHNAGVGDKGPLLAVNVVAPYVLTAAMMRPKRVVYVSSDLHFGGTEKLDGVDWNDGRGTSTYPDSKLFVTTLMAAVARLWPDVVSSAVHPGWVPTKMGGPSAPDDLRLGSLTQEWLATSDDPAALESGCYWFHQERQEPHAAVGDVGFQEELLGSLARHTGIELRS